MEEFQPTMQLRYVETNDLEKPFLATSFYGIKSYFKLQQWWIRKTDEPDDWKAQANGEWRDIQIKEPS